MTEVINICSKCGSLMAVKKHKKITEKLKKKPYYFKLWCFCQECKYVQHFEEHKIFNNN